MAAFAVGLFLAASARADVPACDDVYDDPTIPTCTCTCEASSDFPACEGLSEGTAAPTPDQCPDMLLGRRVLSRNDALLAVNPVDSGGNPMGSVAQRMIYEGGDDDAVSGLGKIDGTPIFRQGPSLPCRPAHNTPFPMQSRFARPFELPYDTMVTLEPTSNTSLVTTDCSATGPTADNLTLRIDSNNADAPTVPQSRLQASPQWIQLAIEDFDYDGYDDIVVVGGESIQVWTAVDPSDPGLGLSREGSADTMGASGDLAVPINEPATGDFNGDGLVDLAWIGGNFPNRAGELTVFFATVCPASVDGTVCEGAAAFDVILDPASAQFPGVAGATSTIVLDDASLTDTPCGVLLNTSSKNAADSRRAGALAFGNFEANGINSRGAPVDELIVTYVQGSGGGSDLCNVVAQYWTFETPRSGQPLWAVQRGPTIDKLSGLSPANTGERASYSLYAQAAALDWYGATEYAVIAANFNQKPFISTWYPSIAAVSGTGVAAELTACSAAEAYDESHFPFVWGMAVGRFSDTTAINPDNPGACTDFEDAAPGDCPYNPQIALLLANDEGSSGYTPAVWLYSVQANHPGDSTSTAPPCFRNASLASVVPMVSEKQNLVSSGDLAFRRMPIFSLRAGSLLRAGDAFGDSVRLGSPTITRINQHTDPDIIIQTPPSMVDYVTPADPNVSSTPVAINFTRMPKNYNAGYAFDGTSTETASRRSSHSFSATHTETFGGELKFPNAYLGTVDIKNQESWQQYKESVNDEQLGVSTTRRLQTRAEVGGDDQVWWDQTTFNVFHFPVIGETSCAATTRCDQNDVGTTGCTDGADGVELTCTDTATGGGCTCLSAGAPATLCPELPSDPGARACAEDNGNVCCSALQGPLSVSFSGPEEVIRSSTSGATTEWYQPRHEPGQVFSYPSSIALLRARQPGLDELARLDSFSTGANKNFESIGWTCSTESDVSHGTNKTHSFETDTSITVGMNKLADKTLGANVSVGYDYQGSGTLSTLNSSSVSQVSSTSVTVNLEGAGFYSTDNYAYGVEGIVLGQQKPTSVLDDPPTTVCPADTPNCPAFDEEATTCSTTGPITVAFTANPANGATWWRASPYTTSVDVALNNPSRWLRSDDATDAVDPSLQCRGEPSSKVCYVSNQPTPEDTATGVWDSLFYSMKGLLVTNGEASGPLRDTAAVGDTIFLQARVYNYSLANMPDGTQVFARFYRQQIDVNNNNGFLSIVDYAMGADGTPLAAVPIGPAGLGDPDPIPVFNASNGTQTIPPFNLGNDPKQDNMSVVATAYQAAPGDECEYDGSVQNCDGAYYLYWVTAWAEDSNGNLLGELEGHGLASGFDPSEAYEFITDVPLEQVSYGGKSASFSNNVGMFKKTFHILPEGSTDEPLASAARELRLDHVGVVPETASPFEPVVVFAHVTSPDARSAGAVVTFSEGDPPQDGGDVFDAEWVTHIRADDRHFVRATYQPERCGPHELFVQATGGTRTRGETARVRLDVDLDFEARVALLMRETEALELHFPGKAGEAQLKNLLRDLERAQTAFESGERREGDFHLRRFRERVEGLDGHGRIDPDPASLLIAAASTAIDCIASGP